MIRTRTLTLLAVASVGALGAFGGSTIAASQSGTLIKARDDCDPATFNAVLGPGSCIGDGDTTFTQLFEDLAEDKDAPKWRFSATRSEINHGRHLTIRNDGGEFHTFTKVAAFGGGCIPEINAVLGVAAAPECQPEVAPGVPLAFVTSGIPARQTLSVGALPRGTHRFECLIHPWMRTTVRVR